MSALRFLRGPRSLPGVTAYDRETGLSFAIYRTEAVGPRGGRQWEYEVVVTEPGVGARSRGTVHRMDTAQAVCQRIVDDRLSGADR